VLIGGKPMVWHVYANACKAKCVDYCCVATDDERVAKAVKVGLCHSPGVSLVTWAIRCHRAVFFGQAGIKRCFDCKVITCEKRCQP
jgi:hypothetical protein